ncbi:MAG: ATP synthase F0 subunit B [Myxococcota bacterium]|nr:ATP synthase F0 subunit B [Myxococcota bacterium]
MVYESSSTPLLGMSLLQIDNTFFIQLGLFLLLMIVLQRLLFRPLLETLQARRERITGRQAEAVRLRQEADELSRRYQTAMERTRQEAATIKAELVEAGKATEQQLLDEVRRAAYQQLEQAQREQEQTVAAARRELPPHAAELARTMVATLLRQGRTTLLLLAFSVAIALAGGQPALAAAPADGGHGEQEAGCWLQSEAGQLGGWAFNFVLLVGGLVWAGRQATRRLLTARREKLVAELAEAARLREEAVDLLDAARAQLAGLEAEQQRLLVELRQEGERERERLIADAQRQAERIRVETEAALAQEARRARTTVQLELIDQAVQLAEQQLRQELTPAEDQRQMEAFFTLLTPEATPGAAEPDR